MFVRRPCQTRSVSGLTMLEFEFEGQPVRFPIADVETSLSPFTGHALRQAKSEVAVMPHEVKLVKRLLDSSPATDREGGVWTGRLQVESFQEGSPHNLTISWEETEDLHADRVEFEGLSLVPTRYEEHDNDDGSITVSFQAMLTVEETERLRTLMPPRRSDVDYWPVVRRGVSDEPRRMRLGRVLWQQMSDGTVGHQISLVDEAYDQTEGPKPYLAMGGQPMVGNLVVSVSELLAQFETLVVELRESGALSEAAAERIRSSAGSLGSARQHEFFRVSDLNDW